MSNARQPRADRGRTRGRAFTYLAVGGAVAGALVLSGCSTTPPGEANGPASGHAPATPAAAAMAATEAASGATRLPPWPAPTDPLAAIHAAGLTAANTEGSAAHYHAHLDVIVDGNPVPLPAGIGIDEADGLISPLHVHDTSGVIHIETPSASTPYYLGQVFREWNVALTSGQIGGLYADASHPLQAYVDGKPTSVDPARLQLHAHEEIALVYGRLTAHEKVPATYAFGNL